MTTRTRHIRRPDARPRQGNWIIDCDCGWKGFVSVAEGERVRSGQEVADLLNSEFVGHLGPEERSLYLLVDQRQKEAFVFDDDEPKSDDLEADDLRPGKLIMVGTGNFIMPEGRPCVLVRHWQENGTRMGFYLEQETGETGELPICEIRTADGRVFRYDAPA